MCHHIPRAARDRGWGGVRGFLLGVSAFFTLTPPPLVWGKLHDRTDAGGALRLLQPQLHLPRWAFRDDGQLGGRRGGDAAVLRASSAQSWEAGREGGGEGGRNGRKGRLISKW